MIRFASTATHELLVQLSASDYACRDLTGLDVSVQYTNIIYGYMGFAGFSIFFILTGVIALRLLEKAGIAMDAFSFLFILWNFAVSPLLATLLFVAVPFKTAACDLTTNAALLLASGASL